MDTTTTLDRAMSCDRCHTMMPIGETVTVRETTFGTGARAMSRTMYMHASGQACYDAKMAAEKAKAAKAAKREAEAARVASLATEKQVRYAIDLQRAYATPATFGGRTYSPAQFAAMSRIEISRVIDALHDERGLQGGR